jgi:hypothetical protein
MALTPLLAVRRTLGNRPLDEDEPGDDDARHISLQNDLAL